MQENQDRRRNKEREDESLGMRTGKEAGKKQSMKLIKLLIGTNKHLIFFKYQK